MGRERPAKAARCPSANPHKAGATAHLPARLPRAVSGLGQCSAPGATLQSRPGRSCIVDPAARQSLLDALGNLPRASQTNHPLRFARTRRLNPHRRGYDHFRSSCRRIIVAARLLKLPSSRMAANLKQYLSQAPHEQRGHLLAARVRPRRFSTEQWSRL